MLATPPHPDAHTHESEPSDSFRAAPLDSPWIREIRNTGFPEPPPPPDPALVALQPLSAAALRNSLQASSRIDDDTTDSAALGYLREARIAACFVYRYTVPPPSRPPAPTRQQLNAQRELEEYNEGVRRMNATTRADNLACQKRNTPQAPAPDTEDEPEAPAPLLRDEPQAPAPHLDDEPDAPASVPAPDPQRTPPPPARNSSNQPTAQLHPHQPEPDPPPVPSAQSPVPSPPPSPLPTAQSPSPAPCPFEHSERLRPVDPNASPPAPPPRSWFFEPDNSSSASASSASSAANTPRGTHSTQLPPSEAPESPRAP